MAVNIGEAFKIGDKGIAETTGCGSIGEFITAILPNVLMASGVLLFFLLIGGGFAIMTGGDNPQQKAQGSKAITSAVIGFILVFAAFWIIQIIQFITGVPIFEGTEI